MSKLACALLASLCAADADGHAGDDLIPPPHAGQLPGTHATLLGLEVPECGVEGVARASGRKQLHEFPAARARGPRGAHRVHLPFDALERLAVVAHAVGLAATAMRAI